MNILSKITVVAIGILAGMYLSGCGSDNTSPGANNGVGSCMTHNGTEYCDVTSPYTGRIWLNKNLGAARVCTAYNDTACYGDYYQWGRNADGHEDSGSGRTATLAATITPGHSDFITTNTSPYDWVASGVDDNGAARVANWSKTDGSSVCPTGYRVPTFYEFRAELFDQGSAEIHNRDDVHNSFLKLPSAGYRNNFSGAMLGQGVWGFVWSSSANGTDAAFVIFDSDVADLGDDGRVYGSSVRCLRG